MWHSGIWESCKVGLFIVFIESGERSCLDGEKSQYFHVFCGFLQDSCNINLCPANYEALATCITKVCQGNLACHGIGRCRKTVQQTKNMLEKKGNWILTRDEFISKLLCTLIFVNFQLSKER